MKPHMGLVFLRKLALLLLAATYLLRLFRSPGRVVKGKFKFSPEDRWKHISPEAKDLISGLLNKDPAARLTIRGVKDHPWAADAIRRTQETMPKFEEEKRESSSDRGSTKGALFKPMLARMASGANRAVGNQKKARKPFHRCQPLLLRGQLVSMPLKQPLLPSFAATLLSSFPPHTETCTASAPAPLPWLQIQGKPKNKGISREQQYWYAMEISPPTDMKKGGGVKLGADVRSAEHRMLGPDRHCTSTKPALPSFSPTVGGDTIRFACAGQAGDGRRRP